MSYQDLPKDYLDDILVRLAHHSAGIEGNTITLPETVTIILAETLPKGSGASIREFYEIENHKQAFHYMFDELEKDSPITTGLIKDIHYHLTDRLQYDRGQFKTGDNAILGADFNTAPPHETPYLMEQLVGNLEYRLQEASSDQEKLEAILDSHITFERIHPFSDGNGRTGRMLMNYSLLKTGLPPLVIEKESKTEYIQLLANQDVKGLTNICSPLLEKEQDRIQRFKNMAKNEIVYDENDKKKELPKRQGNSHDELER